MNENKNKYGCHKRDACGSGGNIVLIDMPNLSKGIYNLIINKENTVKSFKFNIIE